MRTYLSSTLIGIIVGITATAILIYMSRPVKLDDQSYKVTASKVHGALYVDHEGRYLIIENNPYNEVVFYMHNCSIMMTNTICVSRSEQELIGKLIAVRYL